MTDDGSPMNAYGSSSAARRSSIAAVSARTRSGGRPPSGSCEFTIMASDCAVAVFGAAPARC